jgi:predicted dehydrogenase
LERFRAAGRISRLWRRRIRLKKACDAFNIKSRFANYREMLKMDEIDAVLVVTPNFLHAPMAIDCMNAGKDVLVEKPPSIDVEGAVKMAEASKKTGKRLMYALVNRFRADVQEARKMAETGVLGDIYYARTSWLRRLGIPGSDWFNTKKQSGGGPLIDLGVHVLDLTWWIMGSPKPVSVSASTYNPFMKKYGKKTYDVEDFAAALIKFDTGATVIVETSWASYVEREDIDSMVLGTKGGIKIRLNPKQGEEYYNLYTEVKGTWMSSSSPELEWKIKEGGLVRQINYFADCIRTGRKNIATAEEGINLMKMLTGVYESAKGREVVFK